MLGRIVRGVVKADPVSALRRNPVLPSLRRRQKKRTKRKRTFLKQ